MIIRHYEIIILNSAAFEARVSFHEVMSNVAISILAMKCLCLATYYIMRIFSITWEDLVKCTCVRRIRKDPDSSPFESSTRLTAVSRSIW